MGGRFGVAEPLSTMYEVFPIQTGILREGAAFIDAQVVSR